MLERSAHVRNMQDVRGTGSHGCRLIPPRLDVTLKKQSRMAKNEEPISTRWAMKVLSLRWGTAGVTGSESQTIFRRCSQEKQAYE